MPAWQNHPNGVTDIIAVTYVADPPSMLTARFGELYGPDRMHTQDDGFVIDTGCGEFRVFNTAAAQQRYSGISWPEQNGNRPHAVVITLRAPGLERIEAQWRKNRVPYIRKDQGYSPLRTSAQCDLEIVSA